MKRLFLLIATIALSMAFCASSMAQGGIIKSPINKRYGYKNDHGHLILDYQYKAMKKEGKYIYARKDKKSSWGVYDSNGSLIIPHMYKDILMKSSEGVWGVKKGSKWGFVNTSNETVIPFKYGDAGAFADGLAPVKKGGRYGYIDIKNNVKIPFKYRMANEFCDGYARVGKQAGYGWWLSCLVLGPYGVEITLLLRDQYIKYGYIDTTGKLVVPMKYKSAPLAFDHNGLARVSIKRNYKEPIYIDKNNNYYHTKNDALIALGIKKPNTTPTQSNNSTTNTNNQQSRQIYNPQQELVADNQQSNIPQQHVQQRQQYTSNANMNTASNNTTTRQPLNNSSSKSDVDINIPKATRSSENTFAVIIANEDYKRESKVQFAIADGESFKQYCINTLGLPESNVHLITNAGLGDIKHEVNWLTRLGNVYEGNAKLIFYYAGHGVPDESTLSAYLLPVDGYGSDLSTGYKLSELYKQLASCKSKYSIVLLDACFSGAERSGKMMASARGVALKANPGKPTGNLVVLTAASGDETAYPYTEKGHGMFTYYLLKKLKDTNGNATLGEVYEYIKTNVSRTTVIKDMKDQSPSAIPSQTMVNTWKNLTLY